MTATEPRNDERLKGAPNPFSNAISRQSNSTDSCKVSANIRGSSQHLLECNKEVGGTAELKSDIKDQAVNAQKLLALEALHIWMERPKLNTRVNLGAGN